MSGIHNADAQLGLAVDALATLSKTLHERLIYAAFHIINDMKAEDLPLGELRASYGRLEKVLTHKPPQPPSDGTIQATIKSMTDSEAEDAARVILALAREVEEETWRRNNAPGSR